MAKRGKQRLVVELVAIAILVVIAAAYFLHGESGTSVPDQTKDEMEVAPS